MLANPQPTPGAPFMTASSLRVGPHKARKAMPTDCPLSLVKGMGFSHAAKRSPTPKAASAPEGIQLAGCPIHHGLIVLNCVVLHAPISPHGTIFTVAPYFW